MKMDIDKVFIETKRLLLRGPEDYLLMLQYCPEMVDEVANGVGSETSWTYHLTPDTVYGMNINPTSHPHDWGYTFPLEFKSVADGLAWKRKMDFWFAKNLQTQIDDGSKILRPLRNSRRTEYIEALKLGGDAAFWADKPLPPDFYEYYDETPDYDEARVKRLAEIERTSIKLIEEYYDV